jgi:hypothetical protein
VSMEHKAYVFDYTGFQERVAPVMYEALDSGDVDELIRFVEENRAHLTDPYEGAPLGDDWLNFVETRDAHQVGDFALTASYDPGANVGLGYEWERARDLLGEVVVLGKPFGPPTTPFDPGKMGSYFQSPEDVELSRGKIDEALEDQPGETMIQRAVQMVDAALRANSGLYVTF